MQSFNSDPQTLINEFRSVRADTLTLVSTLEPDDYAVQVDTYASPPKWHLAHTSWFFEVLLKGHCKTYKPYDDAFGFHFNSYYEKFGDRVPKAHRGRYSRPTLREILSYRSYIDESVPQLFGEGVSKEILLQFKIGIEHEKQHQELLIWELKNLLGMLYKIPSQYASAEKTEEGVFSKVTKAVAPYLTSSELFFDSILIEVGHRGSEFAWDNESPAHKVFLNEFSISSHAVTVGEYLEFVESGAYRKPEYWLAEGWNFVRSKQLKAPAFWEQIENVWWVVDFLGKRRVEDCATEPVSHVCYFEADAYARWAGKRLPTEHEWEHSAAQVTGTQRHFDFSLGANRKVDGVFLESGAWRPSQGQSFFFGCWEWTSSEYSPYPGFKSGFTEYNDKWFSGQKVLRGGSYATRRDHFRLTYRNFFYPYERWFGAGFRCASSPTR